MSHTLFIILAGVNLFLNFKSKKINKDKKKFIRQQNERVLKIFIAAIIISIISKKTFGEEIYVKFGILHFIAISILLSYPIIDSKNLCFFIYFFINLLNYSIKYNSEYLNNYCKYSPFLCFVLGIYTKENYDYQALDHFPIIPKFGDFALGIGLGNLIYNRNINLNLDSYKNNNLVKILNYLGKNTFNIYLIHFPIIYFFLYLLGGKPIKSF